MEKTVKCILVSIDKVLISEIIEIDVELGDPNCKLINPFQFFEDGDMKPWPSVTNQREIMMRSEDILTIADPTPEIIQKYLELTA